MSKPKVFYCTCGMHALAIDTIDWDDEVPWIEIAPWVYGAPSGYPWRYKLRMIWHIIRRGSPWADFVVLREDAAREVAEHILSLLDSESQGG